MVYFIIHLITEAACFFWLTDRIGTSEFFTVFALMYDLLAFVPQIFFGILKDRFGSFKAGLLGTVMIALALILPWNVPSLLLLTLGNALIHIDCAEETLVGANGKMAPSALFVSGGSFGIIIGKLLAQYIPAIGLFIVLGLTVLAGIIFAFIPELSTKERPLCGFSCDNTNISTELLIFLMLITVSARGYVAYAIPTGWNKTLVQTVLLYVFMGAGKALGGIIADRFGPRKTALISLLAAIPFLAFGDSVMVVSLIGVLLFSMTMPVTLAVLVSRFDERPGFSFGITTVGLFLGSLPSFFFVPNGIICSIIVLTSLCIAAAACFAVCIRKDERK